MSNVVIVDYGMSNLRSVQRGLEKVGAKVTLSSAYSDITKADHLVLPGVGAFEEGMNELPEAKNCLGRKYCGGGWGGYALYLFETEAVRDAFVRSEQCNRDIEPYITIR